MSPDQLWRFLPLGYLLSILIETPILLIGLSKRHSVKRRLFAGIWLTACTYPIVVLVLPLILAGTSRALYLLVAETFAPVVECVLFWFAYGEAEQAGKALMWRDFATIIIANLASFLGGEVLIFLWLVWTSRLRDLRTGFTPSIIKLFIRSFLPCLVVRWR